MSLLDTLTTFCAGQFHVYGEWCKHCTHPSGECSGSCLKCSEEVNFHKPGGRTDYNCQKFMYYYVCRYSWKYCSEILYALEQINLTAYPDYKILSIGCGGAPDLMAFEQILSPSGTEKIFYTGCDINPYWQPIHNEISQYAQLSPNITAKFIIGNIFNPDLFSELSTQCFNVITLEYLLSHFPNDDRENLSNQLFDKLINFVLPNQVNNSPFLFIINDIDNYNVRPYFESLIHRLENADYHLSILKRVHYKARNADYEDESQLYYTNQNKFDIPEEIKNEFNCAINCSSAQLILEVS